jgi:hypothetical protein
VATKFDPEIWEGCRFHKPRKMFDTQCNACIIRAVRLLFDRVKVLEEANDNRSTMDDHTG